MCYKDTNSRTMIKKKKSKKSRKSARRCRTKTRKPKFLSLISLELSSEKAQKSSDIPSSTTSDTTKDHQQLYLFPLHPENLHDENMAYLFSAADGSASTLTGLLGATTVSSSGEDDRNQCGAELSQSASLSYPYGGEVKQAVALVRTALKNKERDSNEERYVRYSEVVERRDEEVTSSAADLRCGNQNNPTMKVKNQRLSLKLDYEEIMNAWSDKGPLYVYAESPQIVPDIHDDFLAHELSTNGLLYHHHSEVHHWAEQNSGILSAHLRIILYSNSFWIQGTSDHGLRNHGSLWRVPELTSSSVKVHEIKEEEEQQQQPVGVGVGTEEWKLGQREASVLRYKEKRQNRLFSKRIRYQVRKLNAEKRPRVKGRFVKRS